MCFWSIILNKKSKCRVCSETFNSEEELEEHFETYHQDLINYYFH